MSNVNQMTFYLEELPLQFRGNVTSYGKDEDSRHVTIIEVDMRNAYDANAVVTSYGYSIQNPTDIYNYELGVRIAIGRAVTDLLNGKAFPLSAEDFKEVRENKGLTVEPNAGEIKYLTNKLYKAFLSELDKEYEEATEKFIEAVKIKAEENLEGADVLAQSLGSNTDVDKLEEELTGIFTRMFPDMDVKLVRI
jgi:hypothetical protein